MGIARRIAARVGEVSCDMKTAYSHSMDLTRCSLFHRYLLLSLWYCSYLLHSRCWYSEWIYFFYL